MTIPKAERLLTPTLGLELAPGLVAVAAVSLLALAGGAIEERAFGRPIIEPLVLAIVIGMAVRSALPGLARSTQRGVRFAAKELLEVAVCLLGATMDIPRLFAAGPWLAAAIVALVAAALGAGLVIGRLAGLPRKLAILVACGNAICGNSAIAAVAPTIGASREDVAASIAFTAVLGVVVVVLLPLLAGPLGLSEFQYGVLTGLTVYAVPQVLAAAYAVSPYSGQIATLVKLARVLMLGPVVVFFSMREHTGVDGARRARMSIDRAVPWFIAGFVALAVARSMGVVPTPAITGAAFAARWLTIAAMAALGLSVDIRTVRDAGRGVVVAVAGSLVTLFLLALATVHALGARI